MPPPTTPPPGSSWRSRAPGRSARLTARVITRRNAQRLQDILHEATQHEGLRHGMMAWYYMDPVFDRLHELVGQHEAVRRYNRMNTLMGMASPATSVEPWA